MNRKISLEPKRYVVRELTVLVNSIIRFKSRSHPRHLIDFQLSHWNGFRDSEKVDGVNGVQRQNIKWIFYVFEQSVHNMWSTQKWISFKWLDKFRKQKKKKKKKSTKKSKSLCSVIEMSNNTLFKTIIVITTV